MVDAYDVGTTSDRQLDDIAAVYALPQLLSAGPDPRVDLVQRHSLFAFLLTAPANR